MTIFAVAGVNGELKGIVVDLYIKVKNKPMSVLSVKLKIQESEVNLIT